MKIDDEWGGVDEKIKELVLALNFLGIRTTGSCEGHVDRSCPVPWVKVAAEKDKDNKVLLEKTRALLDEFYKDREVEQDERISIDGSANFGFWIYSGGEAYKKWRADGRERVIRREGGEEVLKEVISPEEQVIRAKKLPTYQKEMDVFRDFLKEKLPSGSGE